MNNFNKKFEDEMTDESYLDYDETYHYFIFTQKMYQINRGNVSKIKIGTNWKKYDRNQGPCNKNWIGPGTKWQKNAGTRDHRIPHAECQLYTTQQISI